MRQRQRLSLLAASLYDCLISYDEAHCPLIHEHMTKILCDSEEAPSGMNLANVVKHSEHIIKDSVPALDTLEWQNSTLYILDPFLLFYLRWDEDWKHNAMR